MQQIDPELVDFAVLAGWMDRQGLPGGPFEDVTPLSGGTQNVLVRFRRGGRDYVLRRGPRHLRARTNDVLRREARVLSALDGTDVPAPRVIAACPDETVLNGAVFYLMTPIEGFNATVALPDLHRGDADVRHAMGLNAARALSALGAVDHEAVGLVGFGKPEGFLERQVGRWMSELESYGALDGYPGPDIPGLDKVASWLDGNRPATWRPGVMHGDYHLANLMFAPDGPDVAAIVDWEMCTIGDPLLDLGWLLATWPAGTPRARCWPVRWARRAACPPPGSWWPPTASARRRRRAATCRRSPGTRCWPPSSWASCWRARTPARSPGRPRRRPGTCCTRSRWGCSGGRRRSSPPESAPHPDPEIYLL
ncbi:phosphotransferase family protein [Actinomadura namibiensis]|uniref:phosphotransferase family protein n=1 Tax=Actinomadura kijaniata TaxID=46161 RepID=UPI00361EF301